MSNNSVAKNEQAVNTPESRAALVLRTVRALTDEERLNARDKARENAVRREGSEPVWAQYEGRAISDFPRWINTLISVLMIIGLGAAANVSVFRVFTAGRNHYLATMPGEDVQAAIVGAAAFLMAEFLVIVCVLAKQVYFAGGRGRLMIIPIILGMLMAFVGNWTIARPDDAWSFLEAVGPPLAVLFLSFIGERLLLGRIKEHHQNQARFEADHAAWRVKTADPEKLPGWMGAYAGALKDALREANSKGNGASARKAFMAEMTPPDWRAVVLREHAAERWFDDLLADEARPTVPPSQSEAEAAADGRGMPLEPSPMHLSPLPTSKNDKPTA